MNVIPTGTFFGFLRNECLDVMMVCKYKPRLLAYDALFARPFWTFAPKMLNYISQQIQAPPPPTQNK